MDSKKMPVFIKIQEYKDVVDILHLIKSKLKETWKILDTLDTLKRKEDSELELWKQELAEVEKKINFIDKSLFEPETL